MICIGVLSGDLELAGNFELAGLRGLCGGWYAGCVVAGVEISVGMR